MYIRIKFEDIESDKTKETQELLFSSPNGTFLTSSKAHMVTSKEIQEIVGYSVVFWYLDINILNNTKFGKYTEYILSAQKRNINFGLTKETFLNLISKPCNYCGVTDLTFYKTKGAGGIDRIDSNKDYTIDNCVSCCGMCNQMKLDYTTEQFLNKCLKISKILRTKYHINISSLVRDFIISTYVKLENDKNMQ